jgi:hypothetical protein
VVLWLGLVFFAVTPVYLANSFSSPVRIELVLNKPEVYDAQGFASKKQVKNIVNSRFYNLVALKVNLKYYLNTFHQKIKIKLLQLRAKWITYKNIYRLFRIAIPRNSLSSIYTLLLG